MKLNLNSKKIFVLLSLASVLWLSFTSIAYAAGEIVVNPDDSQVPGLGSFRIPTFLDISAIRHFSVFSYLSIALQVVILFLVLYWGLKVIRAGLAIMQKSEAGFEDARKKFTAVFTSIALLFLFVVIISIVAAFLGVGNFFQWPKYFSVCSTPDSQGRQQYYFTVFAKYATASNAESVVDQLCLN